MKISKILFFKKTINYLNLKIKYAKEKLYTLQKPPGNQSPLFVKWEHQHMSSSVQIFLHCPIQFSPVSQLVGWSKISKVKIESWMLYINYIQIFHFFPLSINKICSDLKIKRTEGIYNVFWCLLNIHSWLIIFQGQ